MKHVDIYTDGACIGNPGPGGYGAILDYMGSRRELSAGFRRTTNNRMEMLGAIVALESLKEACEVTLYSDSQYVVQAMTKGWLVNWKRKNWIKSDKQPVLNIDLWKRIDELCQKHLVSFEWVRGHNGHVENERCDALAVAAAHATELAVDEGYESKPAALI